MQYPDVFRIGAEVAFSSAATVADPTDKYAFIQSYEWKFGDGATSDKANPTHIFNKAGEHKISLTVVNNKGLSTTITESIEVQHPAMSREDCMVTEGSALEPSRAKCVQEQKSRYDFTMAAMNQHSSAAITVAFAEGDFSLYYQSGGWPSAHDEVYDFKVQGNGRACLLLDLENEEEYWGYIQATGALKGASIVIDFDVAHCRDISQ